MGGVSIYVYIDKNTHICKYPEIHIDLLGWLICVSWRVHIPLYMDCLRVIKGLLHWFREICDVLSKKRIYCVEVYKWIPWINMCVVCMKHHDRKAPQSLSDEEPQVWLLKVSATTGTVYYLYIRGQIIQTSNDGKLEKEVYMRNLGILFRVVNNCTCHVCNYTDYI